ncbi:hypothetical protein ACQKMD_15765 [Viridibacillus sp. NPDC096237]|uniref:hypothetical protein n=1 Tax=Viridibacillus sp. NPDC096237 TaxID=3390721 RepID=UPI003CFE3D64
MSVDVDLSQLMQQGKNEKKQKVTEKPTNSRISIENAMETLKCQMEINEFWERAFIDYNYMMGILRERKLRKEVEIKCI